MSEPKTKMVDTVNGPVEVVTEMPPPEFTPMNRTPIEFRDFDELIETSVEYWNKHDSWPEEVSPDEQPVTVEQARQRWPEPFQATTSPVGPIKLAAKDDLSDEEMERLEERVIVAIAHEELHQTIIYVEGIWESKCIDNITIL